MGGIMAHHRVLWPTDVHQKFIGLAVFIVARVKIIRYLLHTDKINIFWRLRIQGKT